MALIAQAATLKSRVPFLHFFDGFRSSHEVNKIAALDPADIKAYLDEDAIRAHRERALNPDRPVLRGSGVPYDVRRAEPYGIYDRFDFDVPVREAGDALARYHVRVEEMEQCCRLIEQAVAAMPASSRWCRPCAGTACRCPTTGS